MLGCAILAFLVILKPDAVASIGELSEEELLVFKLESLFTFFVTMVGAIVTIISILLTVNFEVNRKRKREIKEFNLAKKEMRNERNPLMFVDVTETEVNGAVASDGELEECVEVKFEYFLIINLDNKFETVLVN